MKTDDLVRAIAHDAAMRPTWLFGRMLLALVSGAAIASLLLAVVLGVRPDLVSALHTWRFLFKLAVELILVSFAFWACVRLARPEKCYRDTLIGLAIAPAVLALGIGYELMSAPRGEWYARTVGTHALTCLVAIPLLSIASLVAMLAALRAGAPFSPSSAGAAAGLFAAALGAALYAIHCPDDSPLFVAVWYSLAIALVALAGAGIGHRALKW